MADHPKPLEAELDEVREGGLLADPVQLDLIRDQVPNRDAGVAVQVAQRQGPGRRPGSRNKRNAKFREQILAITGGRHPAVGLARAATTDVALLAAQLGCSKLEAAQLAMRAAAEILPYMEGKMPVTVDLRQQHDVVLIMGGVPGVGGEVLEGIAHQVAEDAEPGEFEEMGLELDDEDELGA